MKEISRYLIGAAVGAALVGVVWANERPALSTGGEVDLAPFWQVWQMIDEKYNPPPDGKVPDATARVAGAIHGLVASLGDPYSAFLPPAENKLFEQDIDGQFGGIGIEIGVRDDFLTVISPLPETPAKRAGLLAGDKIVEVNGQAVGGRDLYETIKIIRGEVGQPVKLKIWRGKENKVFDFSVRREIIKVPTIETKMSGGVFVIRLYNFGASAPELFRDALRVFVLSGGDKLVLDLRGNPGGFLDAAVDLASWFLPVGSKVVIEDRDGKATPEIYRSRGYNVFTNRLKLAILVDGGSASASEILAGALRDNGRAKLVGEKTFGKGSVQELIPLADGAAVKLTIARWLTPNGLSISHDGLEPDIVVKAAEKGDDSDPQLARAIQLLTTNH